MKLIARFVKNMKEATDCVVSILENAEREKYILAFDAYCSLTETYEEMPKILSSLDDAKGQEIYDLLMESSNVSSLHLLFKIASRSRKVLPIQKLNLNDEKAKELSRYKYWYVWPAIYATRLGEKNNYIVMFFVNVFLQNKTISALDGLLTIIEASELLMSQSSTFSVDFLKTICDFCLSNPDKSFNDKLLFRCLRFGLFSHITKEGGVSQALYDEYVNSQFFDNEQQEKSRLSSSERSQIDDETEVFNVTAPNIFFKTEAIDGSVLSVRGLLIGMSRLLASSKNDEESFVFLRKIVSYYLKCETYSTEKKYEELRELTPLICQQTNVMNILYQKSFTEKVSSMRKKILKMRNSVNTEIPSEIVSASFKELREAREAEQKRRKDLRNEWTSFSKNEIPGSIWKNYKF